MDIKTLWDKTVEIKQFPCLQQDIATEILIIGGGIAGILTGYYLQKSGHKVVIVEKNRIGMGVTYKTTAVVSAQHDVYYHELIKDIGYQKTKLYLEASLEAVEEFRKLSNIYDFDYEQLPSYMYALDNSNNLNKEIEALRDLGFLSELVDKTSLPFPVKGAIKFPEQGQMNPLKLLKELSKDLTIYEQTFVEKISKNVAYTSKGNIKAEKIIVTTHFPFINRYGNYYMKLYQERSYVMAIKTDYKLNGTYNSDESGTLYFRNYQDLLIIGGSTFRTGTKTTGYQPLIDFINKYFPDATIKYQWSNQDTVSLDNVPYIGSYSMFSSNLYVASGFNAWGMTNSLISAKVLTDLINQKENKYYKLYNPSRSMLYKQLVVNSFESIVNLMKFNKKRCTHMGCCLNQNSIDNSWDCPCHGSRYDQNGKVLDNPAMTDLKITDK